METKPRKAEPKAELVQHPAAFLNLSPEARAERLVRSFFSGCKANTLRAREQDLEDFAVFLGLYQKPVDHRKAKTPAEHEKRAEALNKAAALLLSRPHGEANALALDYKDSLLARKLSPSTVDRRLSTLRQVVALGQTLGLVSWELQVKGEKVTPYRDTRGSGREELDRVLAELNKRHDSKAKRDSALLRLLHDLGLRRGEASSLDVEHLDLEAGDVWVMGKGKTERERLTLPDKTCSALAEWLAVRGPEPGPFFVNMDRAGKGRRLTGTSINRIVKGYGLLHAHGLRHLAITEALDKTNGDYRRVQRFSRHADPRTILHYDDNRADLAGEVARLVAG